MSGQLTVSSAVEFLKAARGKRDLTPHTKMMLDESIARLENRDVIYLPLETDDIISTANIMGIELSRKGARNILKKIGDNYLLSSDIDISTIIQRYIRLEVMHENN